MDITHLTPDAEGSIEWPSFSNDKKAVVTLGAFDGTVSYTHLTLPTICSV